MTPNYYAHDSFHSAQEEMARLGANKEEPTEAPQGCRLVIGGYFTTVSTTLDCKTWGYKKKRELLPLSKMPI